jgi:hypothetical protein
MASVDGERHCTNGKIRQREQEQWLDVVKQFWMSGFPKEKGFSYRNQLSKPLP